VTTTLLLGPAFQSDRLEIGPDTAQAVAQCIDLPGFSPYTAGNTAPPSPALQIEWTRELRLAFNVPPF